MVYSLNPNVDRAFCLDEYVAFVEDNVDLRDCESLAEGAWALKALANNRGFLLDEYHEHLKAYLRDPSAGRALPQSIVPARRKDFYVRANIWLPVTNDDETSTYERNLFSYELAHDHNYHFATVGYFGPGYETDLYEYDYHDVQGYEGEPVDLIPRGRHQLTPGLVMIYRAGRDVHVQYAPREVSVSLNLMCRADDSLSPQQYLFDVDKRTIARGAGDIVSMRLYLIDMMSQLHNDNTVDILESYVTDHRCVRTQAYALTVLEKIRPTDADRFRSKASSGALALAGLPLVNGSSVEDRNM